MFQKLTTSPNDNLHNIVKTSFLTKSLVSALHYKWKDCAVWYVADDEEEDRFILNLEMNAIWGYSVNVMAIQLNLSP